LIRHASTVKERNMHELLARVVEAHGGLARWKRHETLSATIVTGGALWALKGLVQGVNPRTVSVRMHTEYASVTPFGKPGWRTAFTPERVAIETLQGEVVQERRDARKSFNGHTMNMPWDPLHRAYFNGYALRLYLTTPFFMAMPGFELTEIEPWKEGGET